MYLFIAKAHFRSIKIRTLPGLAFILSILVCLFAQAALAKGEVLAGGKSQAGTISFGLGWEPISFHPLRGLDSGSYYAQTLVYEGLVKYDSLLNIVPGLAKSFEVSKDGLTYSFEIREGLHFSDGNPITRDDVLASFNLLTSRNSPYKAEFADVSRVETPGRNGLVFHLRKPLAPLLSRFVEMRILPARLLNATDLGKQALARTPISSGPFKLVSWRSGQELVFSPNEYYWGNKPGYDKLVWRIVPDRSLLSVALVKGELDAAQVDPRSWRNFISKQSSGIELDIFPGSRTIYLAFNLERKPFDNQLLRQAIAQCIDRQTIINKLYCGYADMALSDFVKTGWAYDSGAKLWTYNRKRALENLSSLGLKPGDLAFPILTSRDYQDLALVIADDLRQAGCNCQVQLTEFAALKQRYLKNGDFQTVILSRSLGPDPECIINWHTGGSANFSKYSNSRLDELLENGRQATSRQARSKSYKQVQDILALEVPWVFLVQPNLLIAHGPRVADIKRAGQDKTGLPWDNPFFNAVYWQLAK